MRSSASLLNSITISSHVPREIYHCMSLDIAHSISLGKPIGLDLIYGLCLGRLFHRPTTSSPATWDNLDDTGFYIRCSAIDKSIWAAFDFEPMTEIGEKRTVRPEYQVYGRLPNDRSNLVIGAQKLFGREWTARVPLTLDGGNPYGNDMGGESPVRVRITAQYTSIASVVQGLRKGRSDSNGCETGTGSESSS